MENFGITKSPTLVVPKGGYGVWTDEEMAELKALYNDLFSLDVYYTPGSLTDPHKRYSDLEGLDKWLERVHCMFTLMVLLCISVTLSTFLVSYPIALGLLVPVTMLACVPLVALGGTVVLAAYVPARSFRFLKIAAQRFPVESVAVLLIVYGLSKLPALFSLLAVAGYIAVLVYAVKKRVAKQASVPTQQVTYDRSNKTVEKLVQKCECLGSKPYKPPNFTAVECGGNLISTFGYSMRRLKQLNAEKVTYRSEDLPHADGVPLGLNWLDLSDGVNQTENNRPDIDSAYNKKAECTILLVLDANTLEQTNALVRKVARDTDWVVARVSCYRGSADDVHANTPINTLCAPELAKAFAHVKKRFTNAKLLATGINLGATLLAKYLGEVDSCPLDGAFLWSPSWRPGEGGEWADAWRSGLLLPGYRRFFESASGALDKLPKGKKALSQAAEMRSMGEVERLLHLPFLGKASAVASVSEYRTKSAPAAASIKVPTLALCCHDDPVNLPGEGVGSKGALAVCHTALGGFCSAPELFTDASDNEHHASFAERCMFEWFRAVLAPTA